MVVLIVPYIWRLTGWMCGCCDHQVKPNSRDVVKTIQWRDVSHVPMRKKRWPWRKRYAGSKRVCRKFSIGGIHPLPISTCRFAWKVYRPLKFKLKCLRRQNTIQQPQYLQHWLKRCPATKKLRFGLFGKEDWISWKSNRCAGRGPGNTFDNLKLTADLRKTNLKKLFW